jgi:hypothetical protein
MKINGNVISLFDKNIVWQEGIKASFERRWITLRMGDEVAYMIESVYAGIRSSGSDQSNRLFGHDLDFFFNQTLNSESPYLSLPSVIPAAIIFKD